MRELVISWLEAVVPVNARFRQVIPDYTRSDGQITSRVVRPHRSPEHPVSQHRCRTFCPGDVLVHELVRAERTDFLPQYGFSITHCPPLVGVVPVDHLLQGLRAGLGSPPAQQDGRDPRRVRRHVPERQQRRRPHLAVREILRKRCDLALVDALRAVLARMIHPRMHATRYSGVRSLARRGGAFALTVEAPSPHCPPVLSELHGSEHCLCECASPLSPKWTGQTGWPAPRRAKPSGRS